MKPRLLQVKLNRVDMDDSEPAAFLQACDMTSLPVEISLFWHEDETCDQFNFKLQNR